MLIQRYFDAIQKVVADVARVEADNIAAAADLCARSVAKGGVIHIHDSGHMLNSELVHRAGGLAGVTPFTFSLNVSNPNAFREKAGRTDDHTEEIVALAIRSSNLRAGDILFVGSVSGKARRIVELANQARAARIKVVAITSLAYSSRLRSEHSSGKRLFEAADLVIDNHAPYGDALLDAEGLDAKACPASGIAAACIMWAVTAGIVERLLSSGLQPTVFSSVNAPGGAEDVQARRERYRDLGY